MRLTPLPRRLASLAGIIAVAGMILCEAPVVGAGGLPSPTITPPYAGATATAGMGSPPVIAFHCANTSFTSGPTVSAASGVGLVGMEGSTRSCAAGSTASWIDAAFEWDIPFNATSSNLSAAATIQILYSAAYNVSLGRCGSPRVPAVSYCESGAIFQATYQVSVKDLTTGAFASGLLTKSAGIGHLSYVYCSSTCNFTNSGTPSSDAVRGYFFTDSGVHWNGVSTSDPLSLEVVVNVYEQCFATSGYVHLAHAQGSGNFQIHLVSVSGI